MIRFINQHIKKKIKKLKVNPTITIVQVLYCMASNISYSFMYVFNDNKQKQQQPITYLCVIVFVTSNNKKHQQQQKHQIITIMEHNQAGIVMVIPH